MSLTVTCYRGAARRGRPPGSPRARTSWCTPGREFYAARGTLSLRGRRDPARSASASCWPGSSSCSSVLAAEGLFAADRKRPLPFLPGVVGLVCGRASAAERDVVENAPAALAGGAVPGRGGRRAGPDAR